MISLDEVKDIETCSKRCISWYYHGFEYSDKNFKNMINFGIKSAACRISSKWSVNNGPFYISVSKDLNAQPDHSAFLIFNNNYFTFILDNITAIPCFYKGIYSDLFSITPIPLRPKAGWQDEYQAFFRIAPKKIIGIQCPLYRTLEMEEQDKHLLIELRDMIMVLKDLNKDIPIYDYSRLDGDNVHLINKDAYLTLTKKL